MAARDKNNQDVLSTQAQGPGLVFPRFLASHLKPQQTRGVGVHDGVFSVPLVAPDTGRGGVAKVKMEPNEYTCYAQLGCRILHDRMYRRIRREKIGPSLWLIAFRQPRRVPRTTGLSFDCQPGFEYHHTGFWLDGVESDEASFESCRAACDSSTTCTAFAWTGRGRCSVDLDLPSRKGVLYGPHLVLLCVCLQVVEGCWDCVFCKLLGR